MNYTAVYLSMKRKIINSSLKILQLLINDNPFQLRFFKILWLYFLKFSISVVVATTIKSFMWRAEFHSPKRKAILNTVVKLNNSCHNGECSHLKSWKLWVQKFKTHLTSHKHLQYNSISNKLNVNIYLNSVHYFLQCYYWMNLTLTTIVYH